MAERMYSDLTSWWPLISPPSDYAEEAAIYQRILEDAARRPIRSVLELGSGGGSNASYFKANYDLVLVDLSPGMLSISRALNPECEHVLGDMRTVRLDRKFDAVFVHDAITYMTTLSDLRQAIETVALHCAPGAAVLLAPDHVRENFTPSTDHGGSDGADRSLRFLEWSWDPDPADTTCLVDYVYVLRDEDGSIRVEHDRHIEGLFPRSDWIRLLAEAGIEARVVPVDHSELEPGSYEVFAGATAVE